jgi:environmental stress-induced protein Ves
VTIIKRDAVEAVAWKNGGGLTQALLSWPSPNDWQLRLSVATITKDGPFSEFPGVTRWFTVLEGAGVILSLPDQTLTAGPGSEPLVFNGNDACHARLLDQSVSAFNVMATPALKTTVGRLKGRTESIRASAGLIAVFGLTPSKSLIGTTQIALQPNELFWCVAPATIDITGLDGQSIWVNATTLAPVADWLQKDTDPT